MSESGSPDVLERLDRLVGEWSMTSSLAPDPATAPRARTTFEWLSGRRFLVQRWEVDHPAAPDGIAVIGFDAERGHFRQHYFDSRGVARVYEMTLEEDAWQLWRFAPGFSQRFDGRFGAGGDTIVGSWEKSSDGERWEHDFELTYTRVRP
jgi:hypothetical protein